MAVIDLLPKIKLVLGINDFDTSQDVLIQVMVDDVTDYLCNVTKKTEADLPDSLIRRIVVIRYNMLGSEGVQSEAYSGVSQTFVTGLPEDIKTEIKAIRKVAF